MRRVARWALPLVVSLVGAWPVRAACITPTITIASNPTSPSISQGFTLTATVSPTAAPGYIQFKDTSNSNAQVGNTASFVLSGGTATNNVSAGSLAVGTHIISVNYISTSPATYCSAFIPNTSTYTLVITPAGTTTTTLTASPTSFPPNVTTTLTATVSASATATGTVTFTLDGTTTLATVVYTLVGGNPQWNYTIPANTLSAGSHTVTATYNGDGNGNLSSTSNTVTLSVAQVSTTTSISTSAASITPNQTETLTATVTPSYSGDVPTGTVTFILDDITNLATVNYTLVGGSPRWTTTIPANTLAVGPHSVKAQFNGDTSNLASTSAASSISVVQSATTTTVTLSAASIAPNMADTFTATVTPAFSETPTGTVTFLFNGSAAAGSSNLALSCTTTCTAVFSAPANTFVLNTYSVTAQYNGDTSNQTSTSAAVSLSVAKASTTTTVTSSAPSFQPNQTDTLTATVTPSLSENPSGTVTFLFDGSAITGSSNIAVTCAATCTASFTVPAHALAVGGHTVTAQYSGDGNNLSSSGSTSITVSNLPASTTTLSASSTSIAPNQTDTFTATVTPTSATGTLTFKFNGSTITGSSNIALTCASSCTAAFTSPASSLTPNTYSVTAEYSGDGNLQASTSSAVSLTVAKMSATTTLSASSTNIAPNQTDALTATVTPAVAGTTPTGTVTFYSGSSPIASNVAVTCGSTCTASYTIPANTFSLGTYSLTAQYGGDANTLSSTSSAVNLTVAKMTTTTTASASLTSFAPIQANTFTATITPAVSGTTLTGTVTFLFNGSTVTGSSNLAVTCNPVCTATFSAPSNTFTTGGYSVTAVYSGDANSLTSTSSPVNITVGKLNTTTTLTSSATSIAPNQTDTLTTTVTPETAGIALTGTVKLLFNGAAITGSSNLTLTCNPICTTTFTVPANTLATGGYSITAQYSGDANSISSASSPLSLTVAKATTTTTVSLSAPSIQPNQTDTVTATVTPNQSEQPGGTVTFLFNGSSITGSSNVALTCGTTCTATFTVSAHSLAVGSYSVTAQYSGDANNLSSTSSAATLTVSNLPATTTTLTATSTSFAPSQTDTFTAAVSPQTAGATPTGTVTFLFNGSAIAGSSNVAMTCNPTCTATFTSPASTLAAGTYSVTAQYSGDGNYQASSSSPVSISVVKIPTTTTLTSGAATFAPNQADQLTATIAPQASGPTLTGTVTFLLNGSAITGGSNKTVSCNPTCTATFTIPANTLTAGTYSLTAQYSSDVNYAASTSSPVSITVAKVATTTTVTSSAPSFRPSETDTLTATVTPQTAGATVTGTVTFLFNGSPITGSAVAVTCTTTCKATFTVPANVLPLGSYSITASYGGDANSLASTSSPITVTVSNLPATTTTLTATYVSFPVNRADTFTATVTPQTAGATLTGTVTFQFNGSAVTGSSNVALTCNPACTATFTAAANSLSVGTYQVTAQYNGDTNNRSSVSSPLSITVNKLPTSTTVTSTCPILNPGQACTFTATITVLAGTVTTPSADEHTLHPRLPSSTLVLTGTVMFLFNGSPLAGSSNLPVTCSSTCTATFNAPTNTLTSPPYTVTAMYNGDSNTLSSSDPGSTTTPITIGTPASIPDLSPWGMAAAALLLLAAGLAMTRRAFIS